MPTMDDWMIAHEERLARLERKVDRILALAELRAPKVKRAPKQATIPEMDPLPPAGHALVKLHVDWRRNKGQVIHKSTPTRYTNDFRRALGTASNLSIPRVEAAVLKVHREHSRMEKYRPVLTWGIGAIIDNIAWVEQWGSRGNGDGDLEQSPADREAARQRHNLPE